MTKEEFVEHNNTEAMEMLDFNTLRSIPYLPKEYRPIIIYEVEEL